MYQLINNHNGRGVLHRLYTKVYNLVLSTTLQEDLNGKHKIQNSAIQNKYLFTTK